MSGERLWIVCPSYTDVVAFTMLRKRLLDVVRHDQMLSKQSVQFVVVDDTGGYDSDIDDLPRPR